MANWKHTATRCAVIGCERTRVKGWSTCNLLTHHRAGRSLSGAGRIAPIDPNTLPMLAITCRNCGGVDGCYVGCTDRD